MTLPPATHRISARHYQALCGLALAAIFFLQLQQNVTWVLNLLVLLVGVVCILFPVRFSPFLVFLAFAAGQALEQFDQNRFAAASRFQLLHLNDVMLCVAVLMYLIGQYRLNGLRFGVLNDARRLGIPRRSEDSLSAPELVGLIFPVPLCALASQIVMTALTANWGLEGMSEVRWRQLFLVSWTLLLGIFLTAHVFRYWRRLQMTPAMARLMLQDILWAEVGGEQRRIERWSAWRKLNSQNNHEQRGA